MLIQFTGLSGAGKTTIARHVAELLIRSGIKCEIIDGDVYRTTLCKDLGFSKSDRIENIRRLGSVGYEFSKSNVVTIIAAINPYQSVRSELEVRYSAKTVYIKCDMEILIDRDTKGLYQRALLPNNHPNKLMALSGVNDTYEPPLNADLILNTGAESVSQSVDKLFLYIKSIYNNNLQGKSEAYGNL